MAFLDDKRFILSHIRHSFITCDDTGMCETVMLAEDPNRYRTATLYAHMNSLFDETDSESDDDAVFTSIKVKDTPTSSKKSPKLTASDHLLQHFRKTTSVLDFESDSEDISEAEVTLLKQTEIDYKSELLEDNPPQSLDILSSSFDITGNRRRSNTAQKLEKLKKERKFHAKTKSILWKPSTKEIKVQDGSLKRIVVNAEMLPEEDLALLEFDATTNVYYETDRYRQKLFPLNPEAPRAANTSLRFDTIPEEQKESPGASPEMSETEELPVVEIPPENRRKSLLSLAIKKSPKAPPNPFNEYSRFDGRVIEGNAPTKRIRIFFHIFKPEDAKNVDLSKNASPLGPLVNAGKNWLEVVVLASAKISDLIGLICWQYTHLTVGKPLKSDISFYALKIAEENGDVDTDFPSLNPQDDIKRYGFPFLALVKVQTNIVVTVNIEPDNVFSQIISNTHQMTIGEVVEQIKKKRPQLFRNDPKIFVEIKSPNEGTLRPPGAIQLELTNKIGDYVKGNRGKLALVMRFASRASSISKSPLLDTDFKNDHFASGSGNKPIRANRSFSFLNDHSSSPHHSPTPRKITKDWNQNMLDLMEAPMYACFDLSVRHKLNWTPIEMGISSSKVELNPKQMGSSRLQFLIRNFHQQFKPMTIDIKDVMKTHKSSKSKPSTKSSFKMYYWNGSDYKTLKFEGEQQIVDDIIVKFDNLMRMFVSPRRNEFLTSKVKKYKTFTPRRMFRSKTSSSASSSSSSSPSTTDVETEDEDKKGNASKVFQRLRGSN